MSDTENYMYGDPDEFDYAVNEAAIYFNEDELTVAYGDGQIVAIELANEEDRKIVRTVLSDVNLWLAFLGGLSQAVEKSKQVEQIIGE